MPCLYDKQKKKSKKSKKIKKKVKTVYATSARTNENFSDVEKLLPQCAAREGITKPAS